jgi:DNA polymerase III sliding clamp (beta) subunit (PCNA family)
MKITLKTSVLRAALLCSAKKDIRYYLQGICISFNHPEIAMVCGTNGHILFAGQCPIDVIEAPEAYGFEIIVPGDVIKGLDKKADVVMLETIDAMPKGHYVLGNTRFQAIDAKFPDISRVIPKIDAFSEPKISYFKPEYLQTANEALAMYYGSKKDKCFPLLTRGDYSGIVHNDQNNALVVVMPMRNDPGHFVGFNSDFMQVQQKAA